MYRVYEYCFWEAEQWIDDVQRELTVEPLPDQGIQINYPTLLHWANLSWLCGYSPFDFEFVFETASQKIMSWTGIGDDNCNLQVEIADSTTDIEIALLEWAKRRRIWLYRFAEQEFGSPMPWDVWTDRPHDSAHLVHAPDPGYPGLS